MNALLERDEANGSFALLIERRGCFSRSARIATGTIKEFPEVIGPIARAYLLKEVDSPAPLASWE